MAHLTSAEFIDLAEGVRDAASAPHLAECDRCRRELAEAREMLIAATDSDVPEPSPLFWDHLAARVGDAIAREPAPGADRGWWSPRLAWAAVAVVIVTAGAGYLTRSRPPTPVVASSTAVSGDPVDQRRSPNVGESGADDGWALIAAVADQVADQVADDAAFAPQVGQAELSVSALSADERRALAGELAAELAPRRNREG